MPRYVNRRRALSTTERVDRAKRTRVRKRAWIDPFPQVHGTLPEKMVYAELSARGIPFLFLNNQSFHIPEIEFTKAYQVDFIVPSLKTIIEVQGAYWHSMAKTIEADAEKFAVYEVTGWTALAWWDYDIMARLQDLFASAPQLAGYPRADRLGSSELAVVSRTKVDTSGGIRTMNRKRGQRLAYKRAAIRQRKIR